MKKLILPFRFILSLSLLSVAPFANAYQEVWVPNGGSDNVSVIDVETDTVIDTITVGDFPRVVAFSPDGLIAYVTNNTSDNVSVIDVSTRSVIATITVGDFPVGVAFSPDSSIAYVGNGGTPDNISVIDVSTNTVVATIATAASSTTQIAFTPNGALAYITLSSSDVVNVIDVATNTIIDTIAVGDNPFFIAISGNGGRAYVANANSNNISVINTATNTVIATIAVGDPRGLAISPDQIIAYVVNLTNNVSVIDLGSNTVIATITVGDRPRGVAFSADGTKAYVNNTNEDNVSVINVATQTVIDTITVGDLDNATTWLAASIPISFTVTGQSLRDIFFTEIEYYNVINWTPVIGVQKYTIYREAALTQVAGETTATFFVDHNRRPGRNYTYYVTYTDILGEVRLAGSTTVYVGK